MHTLRRKGWSAKDLERLESARKSSLSNRTGVHRFLEKYIFWLVIAGAIFTNLVIGLVLVPFLLVLNNTLLFSLLVLVGVCFGFLFESLLSDLDELSRHHYLVIVGVVPAVSALSMIAFSEFSNFIIQLLRIPNVIHYSVLMGLVYGLAFITPFAIKHSLTR